MQYSVENDTLMGPILILQIFETATFLIQIQEEKIIDILAQYNLLLGVYSNSNPVPITEPPL